MASFGAIASPVPNALYDPAKIDAAVDARNINALNIQGARQQQAGTEMEYLARASQGVLELPPEQRPAAYQAAVRQLQGYGFARNAPPEYDEATVSRIAMLGIPSKDQYTTRQNRTTNQTLLAGIGQPGTAPAPGAAPGAAPPADNTYESSTIATEGTGRNPRSSATGTGQFIDSTWRAFAAANPQHFQGMTPEQVMAARNDPALGRTAVTWLAQQNAADLKASGVEPSGPSLRIAHWLGAGPAAKVMQAPDNAPVSSFISPAAVAANPELATMTAGQMRQRFAGVPNPSFLQAPGDGRQQVASRNTGTATDGTTAPPVAPAVAPAVAPTAAAPTAPTDNIPPPGRYTREQIQELQTLADRATPAVFIARKAQMDDDNRLLRQERATSQRQAEADARAARAEQLAIGTATREQARFDREQLAADNPDPYPGKSGDDADNNILIRGTRSGNVNTPEYANAYARQKIKKTDSGITFERDMSMFKAPTLKPEDDAAPGGRGYGSVPNRVGPDPVMLRKMETEAAPLFTALDVLEKRWNEASAFERAETLAGRPTSLMTAWTNAALLAKGDTLYKLGVLSGPDLGIMNQAMANPSTFFGSLTSTDTAKNQLKQIRKIVTAGLDAQRNYGQPKKPEQTGDRPPLSSFQK